MSDLHESVHQAGFGALSRALARCRADGTTTALRVRGRPGGVFHLRRGRVIAVESPGAPGVDALLLRSGRLSEADRAELFPARAMPENPDAGLVARGHVGAAELQVVSAMALRDAVFAIVAGDVAECVATPDAAPDGPVVADEDPLAVLDAAARRLAGLAALAEAVLPDRERVVAARGVPDRAETRTPRRREILSLANGRRTPRDIAFALGRGVYGVTVEVSRMLGEGWLERAGQDAPSGDTPRVWAAEVPTPRRATAGPEVVTSIESLPRRTPGASGFRANALVASESTTNWKGLFRFKGRTRAGLFGGTES
ncbi:MarR family transcriptional regulator [Streptomyces sp. ZYX-F-203]